MSTFAQALRMAAALHRFHSAAPQLASSNLQSAAELQQSNVTTEQQKNVFLQCSEIKRNF
jgi:hypothetical protein